MAQLSTFVPSACREIIRLTSCTLWCGSMHTARVRRSYICELAPCHCGMYSILPDIIAAIVTTPSTTPKLDLLAKHFELALLSVANLSGWIDGAELMAV
eukprot:scaffold663407_cov59-Prasinocladus_malaysianus.AAC.1